MKISFQFHISPHRNPTASRPINRMHNSAEVVPRASAPKRVFNKKKAHLVKEIRRAPQPPSKIRHTRFNFARISYACRSCFPPRCSGPSPKSEISNSAEIQLTGFDLSTVQRDPESGTGCGDSPHARHRGLLGLGTRELN